MSVFIRYVDLLFSSTVFVLFWDHGNVVLLNELKSVFFNFLERLVNIEFLFLIFIRILQQNCLSLGVIISEEFSFFNRYRCKFHQFH